MDIYGQNIFPIFIAESWLGIYPAVKIAMDRIIQVIIGIWNCAIQPDRPQAPELQSQAVQRLNCKN
jgi:hypothetical protein